MSAYPTTITAEPGKQELFITREFNASREDVYRAFSEPEFIVQWLGPRSMTTKIDYLDNRSGGSWRFLHTDPQGRTYSFNGAIHEVAAPHRMIRTFEFEQLPERGHVSLEFLTIEELGPEHSRISIQAVFRSVADRDGIIASGMEMGVKDGHERLDELFASWK